jgi:hypothetical protein
MEATSLKDPDTGTRSGRLGAALVFVGKLAVLVIGAAAVVAAIVFLVPEGNDYALATVRKHDRLSVNVPRKIVFVGGSNLAFGLDSREVERETGSHVVNMGMNGYFGVRLMLEEVKYALRAPDIVVIALEYDSFFKSVDGTPADLFMVVKAHPRAFSFLSQKQRVSVAEAVPYVAQQKLLRRMRNGIDSIKERLGGKTAGIEFSATGAQSFRLVNAIETLRGFNEYGDLTSHLEIDWPFEAGDGMNLTALDIDREVVPLLQEFTRQMNARGVTVAISYTSTSQDFYRRHKQRIDELHTLLTQSPPLLVPSPPSDFVFPEAWFFDTVYHVNARGRVARTRKVVSDLEKVQRLAAAR